MKMSISEGVDLISEKRTAEENSYQYFCMFFYADKSKKNIIKDHFFKLGIN